MQAANAYQPDMPTVEARLAPSIRDASGRMDVVMVGLLRAVGSMRAHQFNT